MIDDRPNPVSPNPSRPAGGGSYRFTALAIVALLAVAGGYYWYQRTENAATPEVDEFNVLRPFFRQLAANAKLSPEYNDTEPADLVADAPKDPARLVAVEEIGFCVVGTDDESRLRAEQEEWKDLMAALEKTTGKKVVYRTEIPNSAQQMEALKSGRLHVTAFNTGAVPLAVNTAGFVPLFAAADAEGKFSYQMQILVRAGSPIADPKDLKGKRIGFVTLSSNSGAKAPIQILKDSFGLLLGRDYHFAFIGDHYGAIGELVHGAEVDAVCVASDLKSRAVSSGKIRFRGVDKEFRADMFREIYTSDSFPPLCFGVPHNLPVPVRTAIEAAFRDYRFADTSAKRYAQQGKVRFAPVDYRKDWKIIREVDASLSRFADIP